MPPGQVIAMMGAGGAVVFWLIAARLGQPILTRGLARRIFSISSRHRGHRPCLKNRDSLCCSKGTMTDWLSPEEWQAVALSLRVAVWSTLLSLPFGIAIAYALARGRFPGKQLLNGLVHLPLILPPVVTGYLLLLAFGRRGPVGALLDQWFGITLAFRWTGAVLAAAVMVLPVYYLM